ncbi:MAG: cation transporter [Deltaproteobacteria bacterium]|nr:cation transporter [Deltaproteobacteria bacterium]
MNPDAVEHPPHPPHVPPRTVLTAAAITLCAAAVEVVGSVRGGSLFLSADALHLVAHLGIFAVLLIPAARWHERGEDLAAIGVLALVAVIAAGIGVTAAEDLAAGTREAPHPAFMLLALLGLGANLTTAYLFADPAQTRWSFRAALAHELSDGALTVVALVGALAIELFGWRWVDPAASLAIGMWLGVWAVRLLLRRLRIGPRAWADASHH